MSGSDTGPKAVFMVECFAPASGDEPSAAASERAHVASADMRAADVDVAYIGALVLPDDEVAFHIFVAPDSDIVLETSRRAALRVERIVRSLAIGFADAPPADRLALPVSVEPERPVAHPPGEIGP